MHHRLKALPSVNQLPTTAKVRTKIWTLTLNCNYEAPKQIQRISSGVQIQIKSFCESTEQVRDCNKSFKIHFRKLPHALNFKLNTYTRS